jgi:hypothetical protein
MATTYTVDILNAEQTEVIQSGVVSYTGAAALVPATLNQVSPKGTVLSGALSTVTLTTGTGAQISTARDVETFTLWTGDATNNVASATVALSPDNVTYSTLYVASLAAAVNNTGAIAIPLPARVPAGWYLKITNVHGATLPATTYY